MLTRRTALIGLSAATLSGCAPRAMIAVIPAAATMGANREVFVATTRARDEDGVFHSERSASVSYARYIVSIPPGHVAGELELPGRAPADPAKHFVTAREDRFAAEDEFRAALAQTLLTSTQGQRDVVVYVHGYNATFADGVYRIAQISHDVESPGIAVHYSWPSAAQPLNYAYDRDSVLFARDGLETLLRTVRSAGADHVTLVGHSMGAQLCIEALRQIEIADRGRVRALVQAVVLFSPDIDVDLFRTQAERLGHLPEPFVIFTSSRDRVLQISGRMTGQRERLGNIKDITRLSELEVIFLDVSAFSDGSVMNHFPAATSPALIGLFSSIGAVDTALGRERAGHTGLLPGTVLTLQNATAIILLPRTAVSR